MYKRQGYNPVDSLTISLSIRQLGVVRYIEGEPLPFVVDGGMWLSVNKYFGFGLEGYYAKGDPLALSLGMEFSVKEIMYFRLGTEYYLRRNLHIGMGVGVKGFGSKLSADYAADLHPLSVLHKVGVVYRAEGAGVPGYSKEMWAELEKRAHATAESFYRRGNLYLRGGQYDEAIESFDLALVWDPDYEEASLALERAKGALEKMELDSLFELVVSSYKKKDYPGALGYLKELEAKAPQDKRIGEWRARIVGSIEEESAKSRAPAEYNRLVKEGMNYYSVGKYKKAKSSFKKALKVYPKGQEAKKYIRMVQIKITQKVEEYAVLARKYIAQGKVSSARKYINRIRSLDPSYSGLKRLEADLNSLVSELVTEHLKAMNSAMAQKNYVQVEAEAKAVLALDPKNQSAKSALAELKAKKAKPRENAMDLYLKGVSAYTLSLIHI